MIGKNFSSDLVAAGLVGLPIVWSSEGVTSDRSLLTNEQNAALDAVIAAHVPEKEETQEVIEAKNTLASLDAAAVRPTQEILTAQLSGVEPNSYDVDKLKEIVAAKVAPRAIVTAFYAK